MLSEETQEKSHRKGRNGDVPESIKEKFYQTNSRPMNWGRKPILTHGVAKYRINRCLRQEAVPTPSFYLLFRFYQRNSLALGLGLTSLE